jgi:hypothetical protein
MTENNNKIIPESVPDEDVLIVPEDKILVDKHTVTCAYLEAKLNVKRACLNEKINMANNAKLSETLDNHIVRIVNQAVMDAIDKLHNTYKLIAEEKDHPRYNIKMYIALRFNKPVPDVKNLMPNENAMSVSPGAYEIVFTDDTAVRFDFLDSYGNVDKDDNHVIDFELCNFDWETFSDEAIVLPAKLLDTKIKRLSEVFVYISSDDKEFDVIAVDAMTFVVNDNETGKEITVNVPDDVCKNAIIETDGN